MDNQADNMKRLVMHGQDDVLSLKENVSIDIFCDA